ncbi:hypothetical protein JADG_008216 [Aureobasidium aubasidani]|nr:hypothetical protein JADG_008216 [Aureobasidium pullulans]
MPTMLATILSSAVASLAAALRFLADGLAAIAYANNPRTKFDASSTPTFSRSTQQPSYISATTSQRHQTITMPTMLATILSSAVASLAAALRFLADGLAAIAYANNSCISTSALNTTTGNGESMPA